MKISRIDVIGQNGNDGAAYDGFGAEWLAKSGLLDDAGAAADRSGQNGLPDPLEGARPEGAGEAEAGERTAGGCSGECATCRCGGAEGEGE
ncbi:hypothetical protein NA633_05610 [Pseudomonas stutzeri]|uniref:hypothetical protein n=1 Tax=Stutzerimonas stutzeri TaxID=316 RepID=UPI000AC54408|nr:hypothetical protein [Stutzerimonas stutzeri]MCQ4282571.1 hypothetical protein [Stutzerimonas stutzeri]